MKKAQILPLVRFNRHLGGTHHSKLPLGPIFHSNDPL